MTTVMAAIELPTGRRSYLNTGPGPDIHDPNWIPILNGATYKPPSPTVEKEVSPYQQASFPPSASFSLFPVQSAPPKPRSGPSHSYSKSSLAPESTTSESTSQGNTESVEPVPQIADAFIAPTPNRLGHQRRPTSASDEEKISVGTETQADVVSAPSTDGTASLLDDSALAAPDHQFDDGLVSQSSRSSMISTRRNGVAPPTSKYNRKPVTSIATSISRPLFAPSVPQTPHESPRIAPATSIPPTSNQGVPNSTGSLLQPLPSPKLMSLDALPPPPEQITTPKLAATKSSASDKRQRALRSHPSNVSTRRNSSSDEAEVPSKSPSLPYKPRKSMDSRATTPRSTIYDSLTPTPAPTTPLPQLPPQARRPSTKGNDSRRSPRPPTETPVPSFTSFKPADHSRLASFMSSENTVVFRRFDDVHVRLLLCLQDEIGQLEKELLELESSTSTGSSSEKLLQKTRILRELRKVVSEYDNLLATWNKMKDNSISQQTSADLRQWMGDGQDGQQTPGSGIGLGIDTQQDLQWLRQHQDISSITLKSTEKRTIETEAKVSTASKGSSAGGGFMALFGCASKRK